MTLPATDMRTLPFCVAVLPFLTFNVCYLVAVGLEHVHTCIPYLTGCTSLSSAARMAPENLIFRAAILPLAGVLAIFWHRCSTFLQLGGQRRSRLIILQMFGVMAALSLILYAVTLGLQGDEYRFLRRIGIDGLALSNLVAQLLFISLYRPMRIDATKKLFLWLVALCLALPVLAIAAEVAKWAGAPRHAANNIAAWNALAILCAYFVVVGRVWQMHGFISQFAITAGGRPTSPGE